MGKKVGIEALPLIYFVGLLGERPLRAMVLSQAFHKL